MAESAGLVKDIISYLIVAIVAGLVLIPIIGTFTFSGQYETIYTTLFGVIGILVVVTIVYMISKNFKS